MKSYRDSVRLFLSISGIFAAAHDLKVEWAVVKGISDYADGTKSSTDNWRPFASVMAASVVANILKGPGVLTGWEHYKGMSQATGEDKNGLYPGSPARACSRWPGARLSITTWEGGGGGGGGRGSEQRLEELLTCWLDSLPLQMGVQIWGTQPAPPLWEWLTMLLPLITNRVSTHSQNRRGAG